MGVGVGGEGGASFSGGGVAAASGVEGFEEAAASDGRTPKVRGHTETTTCHDREAYNHTSTCA